MTGLALVLPGAFIVLRFLYGVWRRYGDYGDVEQWIRDHSLEDYLRVGRDLRVAYCVALFGFFLLLVEKRS